MFFFPRSDGPLLSVLIPTRGRPGHLRQAIDSCYSLAHNKSHLEFILKADTDDIETIAHIKDMETYLPIKSIISPRGNGYYDMHYWINDMASLAEGDWIFVFNDDARMKCQDWDNHLLKVVTPNPWIGISEVCLAIFPTIGRPFAQEFYAVRRKTFELLGHIAFSPHTDNWIYSVMNFLNCSVTSTAINIEHHSGTIGDITRQESEAAYKNTILSIQSVEAKRKRMEDVDAILRYLEFKEYHTRWSPWHKELGMGWFGWRESALTPLRSVIVDDNEEAMLIKPGDPEPKPAKELGGEWARL